MRKISTVLLVALALLTAACGADVVGSPTTTTTPSTTTSVESTTTTVAATTTTSTADTTATTLAGGPIDFGPADGDILMVSGVAYDDVLNLRAAPGASQPISDEVPATYTDLVALGNTRDLTPGFWIEVDYEGTIGWVNLAYVAYEGDVTDETANVIDELGKRPVEATMTDLAEVVAAVFASDEEPESEIVQVTDVAEGDLVEVTYDVIGFPDDSVRGVRLHIFAEETSAGFELRTVEVTMLCARGVGDGLCV